MRLPKLPRPIRIHEATVQPYLEASTMAEFPAALRVERTKHDMNEALKAIKASLRLPSSKFPPRPSAEAIARYVSRCDDLYAWQLQERPASSHKTFTLHDGPPYANGELHVGHALNKITKDIICRTKLAEGKRINYIPGWDCHGLPIELKACEKYGWERGSGVDPVKIRGAAKGFAAKAVEKQMKGFRSWAIMGHHGCLGQSLEDDGQGL